MSADKLSRLVAQAAEREAAPVPADMAHISAQHLDGVVSRGYLIDARLVWWRDDDPRPVPAHARPLYVKV